MNSIILGSKEIHYDIVKTDRKTMGIIVDPDEGVIVRSPKNVSEGKIEEVVKKKSSWILQKLDKIGEIKPAPTPLEFMSGEKLMYLGRRYRLKVKNHDKKKLKFKFYQGKFIVKEPADLDNRIEAIRDKVIAWYRERADEKIKERVNKYKEKVGLEPSNVKIKEQKKRWGSCSSKDNLNFNWKLIMAPMSIVDYIVVHELVHLKHSNHSRDFWRTLEAVIDDYEARQEWLRVNGRQLNL
ncbi:MAG: M48 family metallopeptidase [Halanaerobiales bacterium]